MSLHVLSLTCLSVPLCGRTERTVIQQLVWPAETAGRLWNLGVLSSNLNIVYIILCFMAKNKVFSFFRTLLLSPSAPSPDSLLRVSVASFWRVSTGHKLRTLFCVRCVTRIHCFRSNQSVNKRRRPIRVMWLTQRRIIVEVELEVGLY